MNKMHNIFDVNNTHNCIDKRKPEIGKLYNLRTLDYSANVIFIGIGSHELNHQFYDIDNKKIITLSLAAHYYFLYKLI